MSQITIYDHEYLGTHTGIKNTLEDTIIDSANKGYYTIQIFLGSPYNLKRRDITKEDIIKSNKLLNIVNLNIFTHLPYIHNLAGSVKNNCLHWGNSSSDQYILESLASIEQEIKFLDKLNCRRKGAVLHIGSSGKFSTQEGLDKVIISINKIKFDEQSEESSFSAKPRAKLILETMVGRGGVLGKTFEELRYVYSLVDRKDRIGFCIDTCHVFAEGLYDLRKKEEIDKMFDDFDRVLGIDKLCLIHLNDSKTLFNSKQDKHACIGHGEIFKNIKSLQYLLKKINDYKISTVLETEEQDYDVIQKAWDLMSDEIK